jgi:hypothetical protein
MFDVLPVSLNQSSFFTFFESSIMRKIEAGSRLGCRACCVSGMACSDGGFVFNTRLVYFVSEQVFPSGAYFKSALLLYYQVTQLNLLTTSVESLVEFTSRGADELRGGTGCGAKELRGIRAAGRTG